MLYNVDDINGKTDNQFMPKSVKPGPTPGQLASIWTYSLFIYVDSIGNQTVMTGMLGLGGRVELVHGGIKNMNMK